MAIDLLASIRTQDGSDLISLNEALRLFSGDCSIQKVIPSGGTAVIDGTSRSEIYQVDSPGTVSFTFNLNKPFYLVIREPQKNTALTFPVSNWVEDYIPRFYHHRTYVLWFYKDGTRWIGEMVAAQVTGQFDYKVKSASALQSALSSAQNGDVIGFDESLSGQTLETTSSLLTEIANDICIDGTTLALKPIIQNSARASMLKISGAVEFCGVQIHQAYLSGSGCCLDVLTSGSLYLNDCLFDGSLSKAYIVKSVGYTVIYKSVFRNCRLGDSTQSGILVNDNGTLIVIRSVIENCRSAQAIVRILRYTTINSCKIINCETYSSNSGSPAYHAVVRCGDGSILTVRNTLITGCTAVIGVSGTSATACAAVCAWGSGQALVNLTNCTITGNTTGLAVAAGGTNIIQLNNTIVNNNKLGATDTNVSGFNVSSSNSVNSIVTTSAFSSSDFVPSKLDTVNLRPAISGGSFSKLDTAIYRYDLAGFDRIDRSKNSLDMGCYSVGKDTINAPYLPVSVKLNMIRDELISAVKAIA